jgi:hypothetical protein
MVEDTSCVSTLEMNFVCGNIDAASQVRMLPSVMFSPALAKYVEEMADISSIHEDSLGIIIINCVAATLEFSYVLRANSVNHEIPTNLYNVIVARSCKLNFIFHKGK